MIAKTWMISSGSALFAMINMLLVMEDDKKNGYKKLYLIQAPLSLFNIGRKGENNARTTPAKIGLRESAHVLYLNIEKPSKVT